MKKSKILLASILALSSVLTGCNKGGNKNVSSDVSSSMQNSAYKEISDVTALFKTYDSKSEYNFTADYSCSIVYNREFYSSQETNYQYMGNTIQLTYENNGSYYVDYYYEDAKKDEYVYYLDMGGTKEYQTISNGSDYFFQFYNAIDQIDITEIDWEENFLVDEENKKLIPSSSSNLSAMANHIFGESDGEYWEKLEISYAKGTEDNNNYISKIEGVSVYMDATYYYSIELKDHEWVNITLPKASKEYVGYQPYYANETYEGIVLSDTQASAIEFLTNAQDANYTVDTKWEQTSMEELTGNTFSTSTAYADGNAMYRWTNINTGLLMTDYLIYIKSSGSNVYYYDDGTGSLTPAVQGTDDYTSHVANFALDQLNLAGLSASDFVYNMEKGYLMPKDEDTEKKLVTNMFGYGDYYFGLHIYLENGAISSIETSLFVNDKSSDSILSYKKTYTVSSIGTTSITYPSTISLE